MQTLSEGWVLLTDPENKGREEKWFESVPENAKETPVPGIIQQVFPDYHGVAWYWHRFTPAEAAKPNERYVLRFAAVDYLADVWLNGTHVGGHEGGETPFLLDVTDTLKTGSENLLAVRVLNPCDEPIDGFVLKEVPHFNKYATDYAPGRSYDYGGIMQVVELLARPAVCIEDIFVRPDAATGAIRLTVTARNDTKTAAKGTLTASVAPSVSGEAADRTELEAEFSSGETACEMELAVAHPRMWSLEDPFLYRVSVVLKANDGAGVEFEHESSARCGFRDFRVEKGFFRLNGKRIFLKSTHTGNHFPIGQRIPHDPDFVRRDLLYAKASGFNMVRFIAGMALPEQLDYCDEIGLMVYEECYAGWCLEDSPKMKERFDASVGGMVKRDRNHPSMTIWGLLNETRDGAVFRNAVDALDLVRSLDDTRLVLLSSGRWDCQTDIGSVSNPGSHVWEHEWGAEAPGAPPAPDEAVAGGYFKDAGDAHVYLGVPQTPRETELIRTLGKGMKPVFLSEYGIGSLHNAVRELRFFEQAGARPDLPGAGLFRSIVEKLSADWVRFGMTDVYPFLEDMLRDSQRLHARQRLLGFDSIRSNPNICGHNVTGMLDHGITGEGVWTFWREWKPAVFDAVSDGWAPVRWCLFVEPTHGYVGRPLKIEAVLANEDVLRPGEYPVRLKIFGAQGTVWEKQCTVQVPDPGDKGDGPLAIPVLCEDVTLDCAAGVYTFAADMESGGAPAGGRLKFYLSDPSALPRMKASVAQWGIEESAVSWLESHGIRCAPFGSSAARARRVILVGDVSRESEDPAKWQALARRMAKGVVVVFLSPLAFKRGEDDAGWLPLEEKGRCYGFGDWLYHKECVAKDHPIFDGLQPKGIMDWDYYGPVVTHHLFDGQKTPDDVAAAAFAPGYACLGGYASGVLVGSYEFGAGHFVLNTLCILENLDKHPAADRLLINMIKHAKDLAAEKGSDQPEDMKKLLTSIGYRK